MYAVIFKAKCQELDTMYFEMAVQMQELAIQKYGCREFVSSFENDQEITISYWDNLQQIQDWKNDKDHSLAQELGKTKWYQSYSVQITEIIREYNSTS